jgi:hypothetical protein
VTALHNHFFHDTPKVYYMHIGGEGQAETLAAGVKAVWGAIRAVRSTHPQPATGFGGATPTPGHVDADAVSKIVGQPATDSQGVAKVTIEATKGQVEGAIAGGSEASVGAGANGVFTDGVFERAGGAYDVRWTVGIQAKVADVSGASDMAAQETTIDDCCAADAGAKREQEHIRCAFGSAEPGLGEKCGLAIVEDGDGLLEAEPFLPIEIFEAVQAGGHGRDGTAIARG